MNPIDREALTESQKVGPVVLNGPPPFPRRGGTPRPTSFTIWPFILVLFASLTALPARAETDLSGQRIYRVMCVANPTNSLAWQYPLWEKLFSAGYLIEYVGSQTNSSRIGPLKYEPFSNKTVDNFRKQSPDIVLLDSTVDVASTNAFHEPNPQIIILTTRPSDNPEKMADRWFASLKKNLEPPKQSYHPKIVTYKQASGTNLTLHIFKPTTNTPGPHPAIVFFFGGGWVRGTPLQFYRECAHFADEGFVAISADYRIATVEHTTPFESVADGKSAIRWIRAHARQLNLDPNRIIAGGASAGGHVAAAAATVEGLDDPADNLALSPRPNALVLWYAVIDNGPGGYGYDRIKDRYPEISPLHNITSSTPPTLFFLGTKDRLIPVTTAATFKARIDKAGGRCDLKLFEGATHGFGDYRKGDNQLRRDCMANADEFLASLDFIHPR